MTGLLDHARADAATASAARPAEHAGLPKHTGHAALPGHAGQVEHAAPAPLAARGIRHTFTTSPVLAGVDLQVRCGEVLGLIGPNGSGKTTLLRTLFGALRPDHGQVLLSGEPIAGLSAREVAKRVAVVVQEPAGELMASVADMVLLGRTPHLRMFSRRSRGDDDLATAALQKVGALHLARRDMSSLSGGEKQRVLIARALVQQAQCLLLDEPTNHLDIGYQHQILALVRSLGITAVVVLHDLNLAARYCDRLMLLDQGQVRASGSAAEVLRPEVIEPVYRVAVDPVVTSDAVSQLLFREPDKTSPPAG